MEELCRLCLKESIDVSSVFQFVNGKIVTDLIKKVIPEIRIERSDEHSKMICSECLEIISSAVELRTIAVKNAIEMNSMVIRDSENLSKRDHNFGLKLTVVSRSANGSRGINETIKIEKGDSLTIGFEADDFPVKKQKIEIGEMFAEDERKTNKISSSSMELRGESLNAETETEDESFQMVKIKDEAIEMFLDPSEQGEEFLDENELEGQLESEEIKEEILYEANKDQNRGKTDNKLRRRAFTMGYKLKVLNDYEAGVKGKGFATVAKRYNLHPSTLRGWFENKELLRKQRLTKSHRTGHKHRLPGGGMKAKWPEIEKKCFEWVQEMNGKGIGVMGKQLREKATSIANELAIEGFLGSEKWFHAFRGRHRLVLGSETATIILPEEPSDGIKTERWEKKIKASY